MDGLRRIAADELMRRLKDATTQPDARFVMFVGAGCSVSSGIPDSAALVSGHWLPRLHDLRSPASPFDEWLSDQFPQYDPATAAALYGPLIDALFFSPEQRQREIELLCDGKFPGFGYAVLAGLVSQPEGRFNVVLTTNFDDLVADALYLFADKRPLVIPHEALASYIRPTRTRPLVVKVHGDHRLTPLNTSAETAELKMAEQVASLLLDRGLVFLGYGGNDNGIVSILQQLPDRALPFGVYWVGGSEPSGIISEWLHKRRAVWVEQADFDRLMLIAKSVFDIPHPSSVKFNQLFKAYVDRYKEMSTEVLQVPDVASVDDLMRNAVKRADESLPDDFNFLIQALRLHDGHPAEAEQVYERGLEAFPNSVLLMLAYAQFLGARFGNDARVAELYRRVLPTISASAVEAEPEADQLTFALTFQADENDVRLSRGITMSREARAQVGDNVTLHAIIPPPGIPPERPMIAFAFTMKYDPAVLKIVEFAPSFLLATAPGSSVLNASDAVPNESGTFNCAAADTGPGGAEPQGSAEVGPGILARLVLECIGLGESVLTLSDAAVVDPNNDAFVAKTLAAKIVVS